MSILTESGLAYIQLIEMATKIIRAPINLTAGPNTTEFLIGKISRSRSARNMSLKITNAWDYTIAITVCICLSSRCTCEGKTFQAFMSSEDPETVRMIQNISDMIIDPRNALKYMDQEMYQPLISELMK